jgi:hypothetical protein
MLLRKYENELTSGIKRLRMKKSCFVAALVCLWAGLLAQKESGTLPYNNERLDSLLRVYPKPNRPFVLPAPKELNTTPFNSPAEKNNNFEATHPGATVINKTARGTIYNMAPDNMPVLVPDMSGVEKIPGNRRTFRSDQGDRMPNPYYPPSRQNPKK